MFTNSPLAISHPLLFTGFRKDSDLEPPLLGLVGWYDFSDTSKLNLTGTSINSISDKSSKGFTLTAPTSGARPTTSASVLTKQSAYFDGGDDALQGASWITVGENSNYTVLSVTRLKNVVPGSSSRSVSGLETTTNTRSNLSGYRSVSSVMNTRAYAGGNLLLGTPDKDINYIHRIKFNKTATEIHRNGTSVTGNAGGFGSVGLEGTLPSAVTLSIGRLAVAGLFPIDGWIGEVLIYRNTSITDAIAIEAENYLKLKWGISY